MSDHHPTSDQLRDFVQGRLVGEAFRTMETHLESCDSCCERLSQQPESTLVELARQAAAAEPAVSSGARDGQVAVPPELRDHPRYHVLHLIGRGGMGSVYRAEHRLMQRLVALKTIHPSMVAHPQAVQRFRREVRGAARLAHPNIVASYDADQAGELHFLVMEHVDGVSLDQWIAREGTASVTNACDWIRQAALGLQHAHEQGMAHRDIKPHNLMLARDGTIKILDFGLTRFTAEQSRAGETQGVPQSTTRDGMILGTPDYIAPEQIEDSASADIRADIYSLGCTLYHLLVGQPPFAGGSLIEKLHAHTTRVLPRLETARPDVPAALSEILVRMTARDPAQRYATPREVADALGAILGDAATTITTRPPATPPEPPRVARVPVAAPPPARPPRVRTSAPDDRSRPVEPAIPAVKALSGTAKSRSARRPMTWISWLRSPAGMAGAATSAVLLVIVLVAWGMSGGSGVRPEPRPQPQPQPQGPPQGSPQPPRAPQPSGGPRRILLLLPSRGLWFPDYQRLVEAARDVSGTGGAVVQLVVAGTTDQPAQLAPQSEPGRAVPDVRLSSELRGDDYDAMIFIGFDTSEFVPGGEASEQALRLIHELRGPGKVVAALCAGQRVLAQHGILQGKNVAACPYIPPHEITQVGARNVDRGVVADGQIITAAGDANARELIAAILQARSAAPR